MTAALVYALVCAVIVSLTLSAGASRRRPAPFLVRRRDALCVTLFLVFWLVPVVHEGLTRRSAPGMPTIVADLHRVSCLFTRSISSWRAYYLQVLPERGGEWVTISEYPYFRMRPFGYRTRFRRYLTRSHGARGEARRAEMAGWIREQYAAAHPDQPPPAAIRILRVFLPLTRAARPAGRWSQPALASIPPEQLSVLSLHEFPAPGRGRAPDSRKGTPR